MVLFFVFFFVFFFAISNCDYSQEVSASSPIAQRTRRFTLKPARSLCNAITDFIFFLYYFLGDGSQIHKTKSSLLGLGISSSRVSSSLLFGDWRAAILARASASALGAVGVGLHLLGWLGLTVVELLRASATHLAGDRWLGGGILGRSSGTLQFGTDDS